MRPPIGQQLNNPETDSSRPSDERTTSFCITHLQAIGRPDVELLDAEPDRRLTVAFANRVLDNEQLFQAGRYDHFMSE